MATGGFRSNADFLEEWKAKREKMRAKMLGEIAASTGVCVGNTAVTTHGSNNRNETRNTTPSTELNNNNGHQERGGSSVNCVPAYSVARSSSSSGLKRPEDEPHQAAKGADVTTGNLKKTPQPENVALQSESSGTGRESPNPGTGPSKSKEKKSSGPSARKGKGQIEKRKLREKRRSTGVVSIPSNESLDELDDDDGGDKDQEREEAVTQQNTFQNEAMAAEPGPAHLMQETPRAVTSRYKSTAGPGMDEEAAGAGKHRQGQGHGRQGGLERRLEELEKELSRERQENARLLAASQDKDELIEKLREEIDLLNRDLDDIEDENEQLKQENKTLLKVVGQLTR